MAAARPFVIALDGPAASGKSTVGLGVAQTLGYFYFDTGLLYRALSWLALQEHVALDDGEQLTRLARQKHFDVQADSSSQRSRVRVLANGTDITGSLRLPEVDAHVSQVSAHPGVREALMVAQRRAIRSPGTVMAGRDIGTVVVPNAPLKIWLEASPEERARRRAAQSGADPQVILGEMERRDRSDATRAVAPMARALDAVVVETDGVEPTTVVERIVALAQERRAG